MGAFAGMPLPSLYRSQDTARSWSLAYAAACGAGIGGLAGLIKTVNPFRPAAPANFTDHLVGIVVAALGFALLCVAVAALRNLIARRLIWRDHQ
jgi:hypothetical protein